jgi:predicted lipoprotein with Yx(FWY)xxD motif
MQTLTMSCYAAIFTERSTEDSNSTITLASGMTLYEVDREKSKIEKVSY